jgi:hypothetical protein
VGAALEDAVEDGLGEVSIMEHLAERRQGLLVVTIMGRASDSGR